MARGDFPPTWSCGCAGSLHSPCASDNNLCAKREPFWAGLSKPGLYMPRLSDFSSRLGRENSPSCGLVSHQQQRSAPSFITALGAALTNQHCLRPLLLWKMAKARREKSPRMSEVSRSTEKRDGGTPRRLWDIPEHTGPAAAVLFSDCSTERWHLWAKPSLLCPLFPPCPPNSQVLGFLLGPWDPFWAPGIITGC